MVSTSDFCFLSYITSHCLQTSPVVHDLSCHCEGCQQPVLLPEPLNWCCSALAPALCFPHIVILCYCVCFFPVESDLVEKEPCSFNSSRVCECRPGLFCQTSVANTCTRCQQHTVCKPGFGVKVRGRNPTCPADLSGPPPWAWTWCILVGRSSVIVFIQAPQQMMLLVKSALLGPSLIKPPAPTSASPTQSKSTALRSD